MMLMAWHENRRVDKIIVVGDGIVHKHHSCKYYELSTGVLCGFDTHGASVLGSWCRLEDGQTRSSPFFILF